MHEIINKIYLNSPIMIQNLLVSIYGYKLHKRRYGGNSSKYTKELMKSQWFSVDEIAELQNDRLRNLIMHAYNTVPYYNKLFKDKGLMPEDISQVSDLPKIPLLSKETIRRNPIYVCSKMMLNTRDIFVLGTSGTTGTPLKIYCDKESRKRNYAFFNRLRSWNNIKIGDKRVTFGGKVIIPPNPRKPIFWRYDINENNWLFSSYHMSEDNLRYYYKNLLAIQPDEIVSYPSSISVLAKYIFQNKLTKIRPRAIMTSAETLLQHQRELIEDQFECKITDQYSSAEMSHFISQCEKGNYHIHPEYGIVEVVNKNGKPVGSGEPGEIVCTSFINYTMPLIRYRLGDVLILSDEKCSCGRNFPTVSQIIGRMDDILIAPDGRPLVRFSPTIRGMQGLYETQIIQTHKDTLVVNMVVDPGFSAKDVDKFRKELTRRTGSGMKIQINFIDNIPKDKNGKFRTVISKIYGMERFGF